MVVLPVGVGSGAVVLSNGRVVGGISVTLLLGRLSVMFVVAVTTRVEADSDTSGEGVILGITMVEFTTGISIVVEPVLNGKVRVKVVFTATEVEYEPVRFASVVEMSSEGVGVSMAVVRLAEGVMNPLAPVEFAVRVRLKLPKRSPLLLVKVAAVVVGPVAVELTVMGGMTPDAAVELVKPVPKAVEKLPEPSNEIPAVGVGRGRVVFAVSVTTSVLPGGITPLSPVLFAVAVPMVMVKFPVAAAVVMTSVTTVGVRMPLLPVELNVAIEVDVAIEAFPESVVFETMTTTVSDETAVITVGVSTPPDPVDVTVMTELEATTRVLVFGP